MKKMHDQSFEARSVGMRDTLRCLYHVASPYRFRLLFGLALSFAALLCGLFLLGVAGTQMTMLPVGLAFGFLVLRSLGVGRILLRYGERLFTHDAMFRVLAGIRLWFFTRFANGAAAGLGFRRSGDLISRLVADIETLDNIYLRLLIPFAGAILSFFLLFATAAFLDLRIAIALGALFLVLTLVLPLCGLRAARKMGASLRADHAHLRADTLDFTTALREAAAFHVFDYFVRRVHQSAARLRRQQEKLARQSAYADAAAYLISQLSIALLLLVLAGAGGIHSPLRTSAFLFFMTLAAFEFALPLGRAGFLVDQVLQSAQRVVGVSQTQKIVERDATFSVTAGSVLFNSVRFRWSQDRKNVFEHLSFKIELGKRVAILGASGAGKSTLAALLLKVISPDDGEITLSGKDLQTLDTHRLRDQIAWLSQATHLFSDTIRNNLQLGNEGASDEQMWRALERAQIADDVRRLPDGLESWIGEGGAKLSGGQGRRIALARTLLKDAPIILLDEPAVGLDAQTEHDFFETLNTNFKGKTVILIAHRLIGNEQLDHCWSLVDGLIKTVPT